ncbi:hypothetical protein DDE82_004633 [Stemphylium lycopersici]|nr:hypothetical protein DDE82_004633 [Stemphylium lycopersici]
MKFLILLTTLFAATALANDKDEIPKSCRICVQAQSACLAKDDCKASQNSACVSKCKKAARDLAPFCNKSPCDDLFY